MLILPGILGLVPLNIAFFRLGKLRGVLALRDPFPFPLLLGERPSFVLGWWEDVHLVRAPPGV